MMALREHKNLLSWSFAQTITSRPVGLRVNCLGRVQTGGPAPLSSSDRQAFAAHLDRFLATPR